MLYPELTPVLTLELVEDVPKSPTAEPTDPILIESPPEPPVKKVPAEPRPTTPPVRATEPVDTRPQPSNEPPPPVPSEPAPAAAPPQSQPVTGAELIQMSKNSPSIEITPEFEARSGPATDFFRPAVQVTDWYADIPYLDESVDKPQLQMRFYAAGIEGHVERFFDRITVTKTFTTKYGTKIHCAWIGVIVSCGWK